jgi:hypothetical protein
MLQTWRIFEPSHGMREFCPGSGTHPSGEDNGWNGDNECALHYSLRQEMNVGTLFQMGYVVKSPADIDIT